MFLRDKKNWRKLWKHYNITVESLVEIMGKKDYVNWHPHGLRLLKQFCEYYFTSLSQKTWNQIDKDFNKWYKHGICASWRSQMNYLTKRIQKEIEKN
jgi:hypothetical protein